MSYRDCLHIYIKYLFETTLFTVDQYQKRIKKSDLKEILNIILIQQINSQYQILIRKLEYFLLPEVDMKLFADLYNTLVFVGVYDPLRFNSAVFNLDFS